MKPLFSGPIALPRERESADIRRAPAYDRNAAAAYIPAMPAIRRIVDGIGDDARPLAFGCASPSAAAMARVQGALDALLLGWHHAAFVMVDLKTQSGVAFNSSTPFCTQSTIKAIYVGALLESRPEALSENGQYMRDAIVLSSNAAYESLRAIYGPECIRAWCAACGVDVSMAEPAYPRDKNARDNADSIASATHERLGARYPVQTKAGWENGLPEDQPYDPRAEIPLAYRDGNPLNDECAINDTGIVYTPRGPYLFVIYSDRPFGFFSDYTPVNPLGGLVEALHDAQQSLQA